LPWFPSRRSPGCSAAAYSGAISIIAKGSKDEDEGSAGG
jgi:hypothetical protein